MYPNKILAPKLKENHPQDTDKENVARNKDVSRSKIPRPIQQQNRGVLSALDTNTYISHETNRLSIVKTTKTRHASASTMSTEMRLPLQNRTRAKSTSTTTETVRESFTKKVVQLNNAGLEHLRQPTRKLTLTRRSSLKAIRNKQQVDPVCLYEDYYEDIIEYLLNREEIFTVAMNFLNAHAEAANIRAHTVNWLMKIHVKKHLCLPLNLLFVTVILFDMILGNVPPSLSCYKLVGLTVMWVCMKADYKELASRDIMKFANNVFQLEDLLKTEKQVLKTLKFRTVNVPEATYFVEYHIEKLKIKNESLRHAAFYLLECCLLNKQFSSISPSRQAMAAIVLAVEIFDSNQNSLNLKRPFINDFKCNELVNSIIRQVKTVQNPNSNYRQPYIKYFMIENQISSLVAQYIK